MIEVKEISGKNALKAFVKFPFQLYKNHPYWVPPLIKEEVESFDPNVNPVFEHAEAKFFLAYENGEIKGRVVTIANSIEIEQQKIPKMRFGWMDFVDDKRVSAALFDKIEEMGRAYQLEFMEGPVGFSNLDKVGVLTEGYDSLGSMATWYNHPYYVDHYEAYGFKKEKKFVESMFWVKDSQPERYKKMSRIIKKRYKLRSVNFKKPSEVMPYVDELFALFNKSYARLSSFVPMTQSQIQFFKDKYVGFINPEFVKVILDEQDKMIAFGITLPSFARALQKAQGKLFPFGFLHLLWAKKHSKSSTFYLIGVDPEFQKKGVTALIFEDFYNSFVKNGIEKAIITPELEDNKDIQLIWDGFNPIHFKRRTTYRKDFN